MMENLMFDLPQNKSANIKVIGVGGGGSNAVNYMYQQGIKGVDFVVCNTDAQALNNSPVPNKIQLGTSITEGLGAGANPEVGEQSALESLEEIKILLDSNTKMVFITAGMGGGTGTGAAPIIANLAKEMGILTIGICTVPFQFEGKSRLDQAQNGVEKLRNSVDSLIVINNNKLRELYGNLGYKTGFAKADEVLATAAKGIAEVITHNYSVNIDLRDAKTVLANSGTAIMGSAIAEGDHKAKEAITNALDSPLLNNNKITGAKNVLLLIVSGEEEITIDEIGLINDYIQAEAGNGANIIMGIGEEEELGNKISITVVATGFPMDEQKYTGKEEQKIFHQLEEEQSITQELLPEMSSKEPPIQKKEQTILDLEEDKPEQNQPSLELFPKEDRGTEEERFTLKNLDDAQEPEQQKTKQPSLFQEEPIIHELGDEPEEEAIIFSLNQEELQPQEQLTNQTSSITTEESLGLKQQQKEEFKYDSEENNPFDSPISETINQKIQERSERLKQFNFKFKKNLSEQQVDENERIPAFKRQGINLDLDEESTSGMFLKETKDKEIQIKPNNYLNREVD